MFTGIVEEVGTLRAVRIGSLSAEIEVAAQLVLEGTVVGDSILMQGVCLTVTRLGSGFFAADAQPETVRRTTLAALKPGTPLNLERALTLSKGLGGHLVQGHVDDVGSIESIRPEGNAQVVTITLPTEVARLCVDQGSIAVDGISLTIVQVRDSTLRVSVIPHSVQTTTIAHLRPGAHVNLEADLIGRYVYAFLQRRAGASEGISWEKLSEAGFV
ncbi:MAG: riboflavin synthase [Thermoleophilia bacterium]